MLGLGLGLGLRSGLGLGAGAHPNPNLNPSPSPSPNLDPRNRRSSGGRCLVGCIPPLARRSGGGPHSLTVTLILTLTLTLTLTPTLTLTRWAAGAARRAHAQQLVRKVWSSYGPNPNVLKV